MSRITATTKGMKYTVTKVDKPQTFRLEVPADLKYLDVISTLMSIVLERLEKPIDNPQTLFAIKLAVHEASTNIIEHAYHGEAGQIKVDILLDETARKIVIDLSDEGDPALISNLDEKDMSIPRVKGYGLYLIRQLVDEVTYKREGATNQWRLVKKL